MTMESSDLTLDGNAFAGPLAEIFVGEMTVARATCAACGAVREVGSLASSRPRRGRSPVARTAKPSSCGSSAPSVGSGSSCAASPASS